MGETPWGMIYARKQAAEHKRDAEHARENEEILHEALSDLIAAFEETIEDVPNVPQFKQARKKLQEAVANSSIRLLQVKKKQE